MSLIKHAQNELELAGLFDKDSDYNGMIGQAVMELIERFSEQGHSGASAGIVINVFEKLASYKTLQPLTCEDNEWTNLDIDIYQNNRNSAVFKNSELLGG